MKEIYLSNKLIAAVYAGNRVVWQNYMCFESGTAVVSAAVNDCVPSAAGGASRTVNCDSLPVMEASAEVSTTGSLHGENAGAAIAYAKPCLRHFTATENSNIVFAASEANIRASPSTASAVAETGGGLCKSDAIAAPGAVRQGTYVSGGAQDNSAIAAPGAVMQEVYNCAGAHEINAISAASLSPAAASSAHAAAQAQHAFGNSEEVEATEMLQLTPCAGVTAAYAISQSAETDFRGMTATARATANSATSLDGQADVTAACTADAAVSNSHAETHKSECTFAGGYIAEMSLEMYEEPAQSGNFDSLTIIELDALPIESIDSMTIL